MNRFAMLSTTLVAALAAIPAPMPAEAATEGSIVRCVSPDGTTGYTDGSCAVFGAQAVPMDPQLAARITADRARTLADAYAARFSADGEDGGDMQGAYPPPSDAADGFDPYSATMVAPVAGRRSPASGCARNPAQLANDLEASVALGDVNRIAESYHFAGMSTAAGERVLDRLQRYAGRVVVASQYFGGGMASAAEGSDGLQVGGMTDAGTTTATAWAGGAPSMVRLVFAGDDGAAASSLDLDVERYAGCYFVSFA
jgi:hypothetical protein